MHSQSFLQPSLLFSLFATVYCQMQCGAVSALVVHTSPLTISDASFVAASTLNLTGVDATNSHPLCRIQAEVGYGLKNSIGVELWLPDSWNGRFMAVGNGGLAGNIDYSAMMTRVDEGYAVAAGDSGHLVSNNGNGTTESGQRIPFLNDMEQAVMWIHDSMATLTPPTRDLTSLYYGKAPSHSYYVGCSTGGAQGFALAQYHPHLFDGIVAGSPGNWYSHLILSFLWNYLHAQNKSFLDQSTLNFITNKTLDACDSLDGATDRLISNPLKCDFNISTLACTSNQLPSLHNETQCLTPIQLKTARAIYGGPRTSSSQVYPGFSLGSESSWLLQETSLATNYTFPILQNLVFKNLSYDPRTFNFSTDVSNVNTSASPYIDSISADLSTYKARGGKMVLTQGWADPYNAATWPISHMAAIDSFLTSQGLGKAEEFMKLFMIPGGGHCGSSPAYPYVPANWHSLEVLVDWVEKGVVPTKMLTTDPEDGSGRTKVIEAWSMLD